MSFRRLARRSESGHPPGPTGGYAGKSSRTLQLSPQGGASDGAEAAVDQAAGLTGSPLPTGIRQQFEGALLTDLSRVRVHTGDASQEAAHAVGAKAYTTGQDIHFAAGRYQPDDPFGLHLLAHEVAHTVQQSGTSGPAAQFKLEVSSPGDAAENEADRAADAMVRGETAAVSGSGGLAGQIQREPESADTGADLMQLVIEARNRNDLAQMKTLNARARTLRAANYSDPPKVASDALATIRTHLMEKVAELVDTLETTKGTAGAAVDTARQDDQTAAVEAAETAFDQQATPYIDTLLTGDPQYRYYHPDRQDVQTKVSQALRIHASNRGLGRIGHRADAEAEARATGHLPGKDAWCGAFAYTQQARAGGMDPYWAASSLSTGGIIGALTYGWGNNPWIWAEGDWHTLKAYHQKRGSPRHYLTIGTQPPADIQAGDVVLIDNIRGMDPDHVQTAVAYDGRFLSVMGGNQGTEKATDEKGVSRSDTIDITRNKTANDVRQRDEKGQPIPETTDPTLTKNVRLHGVGRWSLVDYEQHLFSTSKTKPEPPSNKELAKVM